MSVYQLLIIVKKMANQKNNITTIKIEKETKQRLDKLKEYSRETYDEILKKMLFILNTIRKDPEKAEEILNKIDLTIKSREKYNEVYQKDKVVKEGEGRGK